MRTEPRLSAAWRCSCACAVLVALACSGCDADKMDRAFGQGTKLSGPNAAIGGVNYRRLTGDTSDWDRHITSCRLNSGPADISFGTGSSEPVLSITKDGDHLKVVLQGPDGAVTFDEKQCSSANLKLAPHATGSPEMDGSTSLICKNEKGSLHSSVRFERCSR